MSFVAVLLVLLSSSIAENKHAQGVELFKQHRYLDAIAKFQAALQTEKRGSSDYNESMLIAGQSFFMLSRFAEAISWLEQIPPTNESIYMLGYAYGQAGRSNEAVKAFARLFGVNPQSAGAHLLTGRMLIKKQLDNAGSEQVKQALAIDPKIPEAHYVLGEMALFHGQLPESIDELKQELAINPNFSMAWYCLGDAYTRQNDWDVAIIHLQRSIWLNKDFSAPYILLGKCYYKKGEWSNAERFLRQALHLDPMNYMANFLLGQTLVKVGRKEEGNELLRKSISLRPTDAFSQ